MNRPDFVGLDKALKRRSSKSVAFKSIKPRNFDKVQDRKVVDVWFVKIKDYFHAAKVGRHLIVEFVWSYLKGYVSTW
jgi:hypothetical protein